MGFREDFSWGVATSSYQIEGAAYEDGKGLNIWDVYCQEEGKVYNGHTGEVACDHYHRYKEDVTLMKLMGVKSYRFSINWARIIPNGIGEVNLKGIEFYQNLINELIAQEIEPFITLYHWELPYELYKKGGWLNEESVEWFGYYAKVVAEYFSDRVTKFFTFNEPQCFVGLGFLTGEHAPGLKLPIKDTFIMTHNVLKAHGQAVINLRKYAKQPVQIGYAPTGTMSYPASNKPEDIEAAREHLFALKDDLSNWTWNVSWFSDPVFLGKYPEEGLKKYAKYLPEITEEDMALIHQPLDFMGENIYNGMMVRAGADGRPEVVERYEGFPKTACDWPITPESLYWGPKFLYERYQLPIYISENGVSSHDSVAADGKVHDPERINFLNRYLCALEQAATDGVDVRGYFQWSLMDNFEWARGYAERFGLIFIDFKTQQRILKDSALWYKKVIETNGRHLNNGNKQIIFLEPVFKEMIWGGEGLKTKFNYHIPSNHTGECWAVSAHKHGNCHLINGNHVGKSLAELWQDHREIFGNLPGKEFPLLIKIIDAKDDLSIQVHPDDEYANLHEGGSLGKTECWYVLDCGGDTEIVLGHHAKTKEELAEMIQSKRWDELISTVPIQKGDFIQINPGTLHAIKANTLILEIQQSSDITYRVYDYDRLSNGKPRELHLNKALDVIIVPAPDAMKKNFNSNHEVITELIDCPYYKVHKIKVQEDETFVQDKNFMIITVIDGIGLIDNYVVKKGDHFILPSGYGKFKLQGKMTLITASV